MLLQVVLELTFIPIMFFSIFAVNAVADRETPWGIGGLGGQGLDSGLWIVLLILGVGWTMLALG